MGIFKIIVIDLITKSPRKSWKPLGKIVRTCSIGYCLAGIRPRNQCTCVST